MTKLTLAAAMLAATATPAHAGVMHEGTHVCSTSAVYAPCLAPSSAPLTPDEAIMAARIVALNDSLAPITAPWNLPPSESRCHALMTLVTHTLIAVETVFDPAAPCWAVVEFDEAGA